MTAGLLQFDAVLPRVKARIARRLLLGGRPLDPVVFAARGFELSPSECEVAAEIERAGLATCVAESATAGDGSQRLVIGLADGETVETVVMTSGAVCVSTQVGCAVGCRFCASGLDGLRRNLTAEEIVEQVVHARRRMRVDRVVFMGIGEPTHNLDAVVEAVALLRHDAIISPRKQTLSTVGSTRAFERLAGADVRPCVALSLHTADDELRRELLPRAPRESVAELVAAADHYGRQSGAPVQFEWTVLRGINDRDADVDALCDLLVDARGYVNFILWNEVEGLPFAQPDRARVIEMVRRVKSRGILATIRDSAGADARAACGQLRRDVRRTAAS